MLLLIILVVDFIVLRIVVSKNSKFFLRINPYIQMMFGFVIAYILFLILKDISVLLWSALIITITMYLGILFQEYYFKLSDHQKRGEK